MRTFWPHPADQIVQKLKVQSLDFIGSQINDSSKERLARSLERCIDEIPGTSQVKCSLAWDVMKLRDKMLWWLTTIVFRSISLELRKFMTNGSPVWLIDDPHTTVIVDLMFTKPTPIDKLNLASSISVGAIGELS